MPQNKLIKFWNNSSDDEKKSFLLIAMDALVSCGYTYYYDALQKPKNALFKDGISFLSIGLQLASSYNAHKIKTKEVKLSELSSSRYAKDIISDNLFMYVSNATYSCLIKLQNTNSFGNYLQNDITNIAVCATLLTALVLTTNNQVSEYIAKEKYNDNQKQVDKWQNIRNIGCLLSVVSIVPVVYMLSYKLITNQETEDNIWYHNMITPFLMAVSSFLATMWTGYKTKIEPSSESSACNMIKMMFGEIVLGVTDGFSVAANTLGKRYIFSAESLDSASIFFLDYWNKMMKRQPNVDNEGTEIHIVTSGGVAKINRTESPVIIDDTKINRIEVSVTSVPNNKISNAIAQETELSLR